jgi:plastocyanin
MLKGRILSTLAAATIVAGPLALAPAVPAQAATVVKATSNLTFKPKTVNVNKGAKVVWKNTCSCTHTVTATSRNWSKDKTIQAGESTSFTFRKRGTFRYECTIHAGMTGKVVVG